MNIKLKSNSLISIVMPTFNQSKYITHSINSVLNQTFKNWELLIVDNFSSDDTLSAIARFPDPRIKLFQTNNGGVIAKSRNIAITASKGSWIAFLDSDDYWFPNKLEEMVKYLHSDYDLIYHHMEVVIGSKSSANNEILECRILHEPVLKDLILNGNGIATSSVLVRKRRLIEVNCMNEAPELIGVEDYNTWLRISTITEAFKLAPIVLGAYRKHENNISLLNGVNLHFKAFEEFLPRLSSREQKILNLNHMYTSARFKYLNQNYNNLRNELRNLVISGKASHKFKALWMLITLWKV
jgi:glycosyltransferase involved in cell wall biosynthesis